LRNLLLSSTKEVPEVAYYFRAEPEGNWGPVIVLIAFGAFLHWKWGWLLHQARALEHALHIHIF
jgi:hypothetical protein